MTTTHPNTGTYFSPELDQWEAWAVSSTGEETLLGTLSKEADNPEARGIWSHKVWGWFLSQFGGLLTRE